uniref:Carboxylesterase type B domain-containing protein n=1 Tax=Glossina morsitans morsitans TaxID=37546 RepID=A0A1B0FLX7_GLOMM
MVFGQRSLHCFVFSILLLISLKGFALGYNLYDDDVYDDYSNGNFNIMNHVEYEPLEQYNPERSYKTQPESHFEPRPNFEIQPKPEDNSNRQESIYEIHSDVVLPQYNYNESVDNNYEPEEEHQYETQNVLDSHSDSHEHPIEETRYISDDNHSDVQDRYYENPEQNNSEQDNYDIPQENYFSSENMSPIYQPLLPHPQTQFQDSAIIAVPRLGEVRGIYAYKMIKSRPINAYFGLRYGSVKSKLGRFQKASPPQNLLNIINAREEPPPCPQFPEISIINDREKRGEKIDDCLTLNIYAPSRKGSYPVLVFVHGEMLFDGSAAEGQPDYFLEHDIVLVTINYRLAPFGYLTTLTEAMPGNVALADVQMALEWIQEYIRPFNGNPDSVTLMGQAGGATLIHALSISGKAQGLFHKLILQSGTALNPYFLDEQPLNTLRNFAHYARCSTLHTIESFVNCFEHMSTTDLLRVFKTFFEINEPRGLAFNSAFKLVIGDHLGYLPQHPMSLVSNSAYPTLIGVTKDAGAFIMSRFYNQLSVVHSGNISDYTTAVLKHITQTRHYRIWKYWALEHIFTSDDMRNPTLSSVAHKLLELVNLVLYRGPVIDSIRYIIKNYPIYMYCFDYRGEYHRFGHLRNPLPFEVDATLSDDNIFLFPYPIEVSQLNEKDRTMARTMVTMWVNFAYHNIPNFNEGVWPNVSTEHGPFLRFTNFKEIGLELDYHFADGIPVPNLYPEFFTNTTTTTTSTTTTTKKVNSPNYSQHPNYPLPPSYVYNQRSQSLSSHYKAHEHLLQDQSDQTNAENKVRPNNYPQNSMYVQSHLSSNFSNHYANRLTHH